MRPIKACLLVSLLFLPVAGMGDPPVRTFAFHAQTAEDAKVWQGTLREKLFSALKIDALRAAPEASSLKILNASTVEMGGISLEELTFLATPKREMKILVGKPATGTPPYPAVVCIHGHGGTRTTPFDGKNPIYKQFGVELVRRGFVVIAPDVGQHEVYEEGNTLMGERLWDCMRCVDLASGLPYVDPKRIACAGLSLGGEMTMWLGAMDTRIAASSSCGFLTRMDQMEHNHCMCWKFDGLRELADFPDIYALIAPRPLQCQNGEKEPPNQFPPALAREALKEIAPAYTLLGAPSNLQFHVHSGAHEIDLPALLAFLETRQ